VTLVTKPNIMEITGFPSFIVLYCNLLKNHIYIKLFCTVAVGRSACEHCKRIQVSPTNKRQATDIFHTQIRTYTFTVPLVFHNAVSECYTIIKNSLKDRDKKTP
jgi:hypothetical protein